MKRPNNNVSGQANKRVKPENSNENSSVVFVGQLPFSATQEEIQALASEYGHVKAVRMTKKSIKSKGKVQNLFTGCAHIEYQTVEEAALAAKKLKGKKFQNRVLNADRASHRSGPPKPREPTGEPSNTLYVGNLPFNFDRESFDAVFGRQRGFKASRVGDGQRGFAYVQFENVEDASATLRAMNGGNFQGRQMRIDFANSRQTNEFKSNQSSKETKGSTPKELKKQNRPQNDTSDSGNATDEVNPKKHSSKKSTAQDSSASSVSDRSSDDSSTNDENDDIHVPSPAPRLSQGKESVSSSDSSSSESSDDSESSSDEDDDGDASIRGNEEDDASSDEGSSDTDSSSPSHSSVSDESSESSESSSDGE